MMRYVESQQQTILSVFPLRTCIIPKYICLDTAALIYLFGRRYLQRSNSELKGNVNANEEYVWSNLFKLESKIFKTNRNSNFSFHYMIFTDGVACSILKSRKKQNTRKVEEKYITEERIENIQGKRHVGIDPGKEDLLYCTQVHRGEENNTTIKLRYSQNQRRFESKMKVFQKRRENLASNTIIQEISVVAWQTSLGNFNSKTVDFDRFKDYIVYKNWVNSFLLPHYGRLIYRYWKWYGFIFKRRSEDRFISRFKETFGGPEETFIGIGDWEQSQQMRWKEPTKGKGFRKLFRKAGYQVYLVDEYRTSVACSKCRGRDARCEKFRYVPNPRPWKNEFLLRHGLLRCNQCGTLWNRDTNGSLNIEEIVHCAKTMQPRPPHLERNQ